MLTSGTQSGRAAPLLTMRGVTKRYRGRLALTEVNLDLFRGEVCAITGANGSGKSTLLSICAGLIAPSTGSVRRTRRFGFSPQHHGINPLLTPDEHYRLFGAAAGMPAREAVTTGRRLAASLGWDTGHAAAAGELSGGTQQKLNVVLAELNNPELILLDEPYQGFDHGSYLNFWDQVFRWRDADKGVLVVTHMLHDLQRIDHVLELAPPQERQ